MRIAMLEDDRSQAFVLRHCLVVAGHQVVSFDRGLNLIKAAEIENFDALLLDWNVPDLSGLEVLQRVRNELASNIPAVVVTSRNAEEDIVHALKQGADDYICKPIRPKELVARLDSIKRRDEGPSNDDVLEFGSLRVNVADRQALLHTTVVSLSVKDFELAVFLLRNVGRMLSRRKIIDSVWGPTVAVASRTLDTHVSRVRTKLQLTQEKGWHLGAVYGHGYRLERLHSAR
jgi:two-component system response regulator RegX3